MNDAPAPTHTTVLHTDEPVQIIVNPSGEEWCWVMRPFITEVAPTLTVGELLFMLQIFDLRDRLTNRTPSSPDRLLAARMKCSKSGVSKFRHSLLAHPQRPLALHENWVYEPMPGRVWKQRRPSTGVDEPGESVHARGRLSTPVDTPEPRHRVTRARFDPEIENFVDDESLRLLMSEGRSRPGGSFTRRDAIGLLKATGADLEQVRIAIRNADAKAHGGQMKNWRGYVAAQLRNGCSLFSGLQVADEEAERNRQSVVRVAAWLVEVGADDEARLIQDWWNSIRVDRKARAIDGRDRNLGNDRLATLLLQKATAGQGVRS